MRDIGFEIAATAATWIPSLAENKKKKKTRRRAVSKHATGTPKGEREGPTVAVRTLGQRALALRYARASAALCARYPSATCTARTAASSRACRQAGKKKKSRLIFYSSLAASKFDRANFSRSHWLVTNPTKMLKSDSPCGAASLAFPRSSHLQQKAVLFRIAQSCFRVCSSARTRRRRTTLWPKPTVSPPLARPVPVLCCGYRLRPKLTRKFPNAS